MKTMTLCTTRPELWQSSPSEKQVARSDMQCVMFLQAVFAALAMAGGSSLRAQDAAPSVAEIDLASDTAWTASADGAAARPIVVPGGGWNSDRQPAPHFAAGTPRGAERGNSETRPAVGTRRWTSAGPRRVHPRPRPTGGGQGQRALPSQHRHPGRLEESGHPTQFGGVNLGEEVFLDGRKVGEHHGPMMPFMVDLTGIAKPGCEHRLDVRAYHSRHYNREGMCAVPVRFDYEYSRTFLRPGMYVQDVLRNCKVRPALFSSVAACEGYIRPSLRLR